MGQPGDSLGKRKRWKVLAAHSNDEYFDDLPKAKRHARQHEGALIQEQYPSGDKFARYYTQHGQVKKV